MDGTAALSKWRDDIEDHEAASLDFHRRWVKNAKDGVLVLVAFIGAVQGAPLREFLENP